jgi:hypothetical protein
MCRVVVIALSAKPIPAAFLTAVGANRDSAIRTLRNGWLAARKGIGSFTLPVFHLTVKHLLAPIPHKLIRNNASPGQARCGARAQIVLRGLASENSYDSEF